jgi:hypothetical protein
MGGGLKKYAPGQRDGGKLRIPGLTAPLFLKMGMLFQGIFAILYIIPIRMLRKYSY